MGRGRKKSHKGGHRHFTSEDDMAVEAEKARKEQEWRQMKGIDSDEEVGEGATAPPAGAAVKPEKKDKPLKSGQPGELPSSSSEEESSDEDAEEDKPKGVAHLIEIENPNRMKPKAKKITELNVDLDGPPVAAAEGAQGGESVGGAASVGEPGSNLSRRQREELEKVAAKERYDKLHQAGKTDEARADLARLALIRKQREDAAKKRDEEKKAQDDAKTAAEQRLLDKKQKTSAAADSKH